MSHTLLFLNLWCGEGDLNPHEITPASTSTYVRHLLPCIFSVLVAPLRCDRGRSRWIDGTITSQEFSPPEYVCGRSVAFGRGR
jgi:hypothetical protein